MAKIIIAFQRKFDNGTVHNDRLVLVPVTTKAGSGPGLDIAHERRVVNATDEVVWASVPNPEGRNDRLIMSVLVRAVAQLAEGAADPIDVGVVSRFPVVAGDGLS